MKKIVLTPNPYRDRNFKYVTLADKLLREAGLETRICLAFDVDRSFELPDNVVLTELNHELRDADLLVCFGGDGTILHASKLATAHNLPILGINIGKNAVTPIENALSDYEKCLDKVYDAADYIAVNISSPNTKNLRQLQGKGELDHLVEGIVKKREELKAARNGKHVPIAVKIAPDLENDEILRCVDTLIANGIDGVICTNTTIGRKGVEGLDHANETGGLSGAPLRERSTEVVRLVADHVKGAIPIIASGGVMTGADAVEKIEAGAQLVQLFTGFIYNGPKLVADSVEAVAAWRAKQGR